MNILNLIEETKNRYTKETNINPTCLYLGEEEYDALLNNPDQFRCIVDLKGLTQLGMAIYKVDTENHCRCS